jgi:hypothetical protein
LPNVRKSPIARNDVDSNAGVHKYVHTAQPGFAVGFSLILEEMAISRLQSFPSAQPEALSLFLSTAA